MRKILMLILSLSFFSAVLAEGNGGYAGSFLRIGLGARGMAMGNAQAALPPNGFSFYYNPASLPYLEKKSANLSYSFLSLDRRFNNVGISTPLKPDAGFAIGWIYSGVADIMGYNSNSVETGEISHGLHAIYFSFGIQIIPNRLSVGTSAKLLIENLSDEEKTYEYNGKGVGADLGILFKVNRWLLLGYQLKDVNASLESNSDKIYDRGMTIENKFPLSNRAGLYLKSPINGLNFSYDVEWSDAGEEKYHFGAEYLVPAAALRLGYDDDHFTFGGGFEFSTGVGIQASLNYAFISSVIDEGVSHVFTWEFGL